MIHIYIYIYIYIYILTLSAFYIKREIYITNSRRHIFETVIYTQTHTHIYIYVYIHTYIYIFFKAVINIMCNFLKKLLKTHIFVEQIFRNHFGSFFCASSIHIYICIYIHIYTYIHIYMYLVKRTNNNHS